MAAETSKPQQQAQPQSSQVQAKQLAAFTQHLEHASAIVRTWPVWKQQILGGTATQHAASTSNSTASRK